MRLDARVAISGHLVGEKMGGRSDNSAVVEGTNAIRLNFDEDEPSALIFNDRACPSALVSWAWNQLRSLDSLLIAVAESGYGGDGSPGLAAAVRTMLVPAINALEFSERRVDALRRSRPIDDVPDGQK